MPKNGSCWRSPIFLIHGGKTVFYHKIVNILCTGPISICGMSLSCRLLKKAHLQPANTSALDVLSLSVGRVLPVSAEAATRRQANAPSYGVIGEDALQNVTKIRCVCIRKLGRQCLKHPGGIMNHAK
jgi:hypothetical protein